MDVRYRIRDARADDLVAIAGIEERSFSDPWSVVTLGDATADLALVADCNGRAVAYLFGRTAADEGEILNLAVADTHRRMGIGRALVRAALERFQDEGVRTVFLEVRESNVAARTFYAGLGFETVGKRPRYYSRPSEAAILMSCCVPATGGHAAR